jgi:hypothetical protein
MESFVFREMNKATRDKDVTKIKYYGPLARALSFIIHSSNSDKSTNQGKSNTVYRGLTLPQAELDKKYKVGDKMRL